MPQKSANTETVICNTCDNGTTVTEVPAPHPVWTDSQGTAVVQLNMVVLGGENGLNN